MEYFFIGARALWRVRIYRVVLMGIAAVAVQSLIFWIVGLWLNLVRPSVAVLIGTETGLIVNFFLNNRFSFSDRLHAPLLARLARFHLTVLGSFLTQWLMVFAAEQVTTDVRVLWSSYLAGVLIGFVFNYTGYRLWVWRHHQPPQI